jgi:hypothetical protein
MNMLAVLSSVSVGPAPEEADGERRSQAGGRAEPEIGSGASSVITWREAQRRATAA